MSLIYVPKGKAREYAPLALNIYDGCTNGCIYCYVPDMPVCKYRNITREQFHADAKLRYGPERFFNELIRDCKKLAGDPREVLLCFTCDPYPSPDHVETTLRVLKVFANYKMRVNVLTKNPWLIKTHLSIYEENAWTIGTTVTTTDRVECKIREPGAQGAGGAYGRLSDLRRFKEWSPKIRTWVSLEPVIEPWEALSALEYAQDWVDEWKIGPLNHHPELVKDVDWPLFVRNVRRRFPDLNITFKDALKKYDTGAA